MIANLNWYFSKKTKMFQTVASLLNEVKMNTKLSRSPPLFDSDD